MRRRAAHPRALALRVSPVRTTARIGASPSMSSANSRPIPAAALVGSSGYRSTTPSTARHRGPASHRADGRRPPASRADRSRPESRERLAGARGSADQVCAGADRVPRFELHRGRSSSGTSLRRLRKMVRQHGASSISQRPGLCPVRPKTRKALSAARPMATYRRCCTQPWESFRAAWTASARRLPRSPAAV